MSKLTLKLNGQVPLDLFATAIRGFKGLVDELTKEHAPHERIEWVVVDLESGSATATIVGISNNPKAVDDVVSAYDCVGRAIREHTESQLPKKIQRQVNKITSVLNGKISEVVLEGEETNVISTESAMSPSYPTRLVSALGAVEGLVQTLSSRKGLKFTLYDSVFDRSVVCHFSADEKERERQEEMMRSVWDRRAIVQGVVTRDPVTGRPIEIRQISEVIPVIGTADFRLARGAFKSKELPEDVIRRARDAE